MTNTAGCAWISGLVGWYAGASAAIDRMLDGTTLLVPVVLVSLVGGGITLLAEPKFDKGALGTAAFLAGGLVLLGFDLAALANRHADRSHPVAERATVLSFQDPAKGPRTVSLSLQGKRVSFAATHAEGCRIGDTAQVELHDGALGAAWMRSIRCRRS